MSSKEMLAGKYPYPPSLNNIPYPLTAAVFAIPFTLFTKGIAGAIFFGLSCFLLAFGVTEKNWRGLWIFTSFPLFSAMIFVQWSPLAVAAVFFPWIGIAALKPQLGLPVLVASRDWRTVASPLLLLLVSLVIRPSWPREWLSLTHGYPFFLPLLFSPGFLLLPLVRWIKRRDVQLLLVMAIMPQRWFYDTLLLWLVPETEKEYLWLSGISWVGGIYWFHLLPDLVYENVWVLMVATCYAPAMLIIVHRLSRRLF
jgi:hypothetical protein